LAPLLLGFALLLAVGIGNAWLTRQAAHEAERVAHTIEVQRQANLLQLALLDAETGQRGYLLTRNAANRVRYQLGRNETPLAYERLRQLVTDNPAQESRVAALKPLLDERLALLERGARLVDAGDLRQALNLVRLNRGKRIMDELRVRLAAFADVETVILRERRAQAERTADLLLVMTFIGLSIASVLAWSSVRALRDYTRSLEVANRKVRALNDNLEATVATRTADLAAANEEIQRFAYIVSHDLRAPLVNVMGFTRELEGAQRTISAFAAAVEARAPDLLTPDARLAIEEDLPESLGFIRSSTGRMDGLIKAILDVSREGRRVLSPETVDMTALVAKLSASLRHQLDESGGEIVGDNLPTILADRQIVEQIFGNLFDNALKYREPARAPRIVVTAMERSGMVEFAVTDNGRGIADADRERVFELFRRAGVQDVAGDGVGLATVRALVRRLGGRIDLESVAGEGSTFTVTLPRVAISEPKRATA
jgi:signal transduction histidine kinase